VANNKAVQAKWDAQARRDGYIESCARAGHQPEPKELERLDSALAQARLSLESLQHKGAGNGAIINQVKSVTDRWLSGVRGASFVVVSAKPSKSIADDLQALSTLDKSILRIEAQSVLPFEESWKLIEAQVEKLIKQGTPKAVITLQDLGGENYSRSVVRSGATLMMPEVTHRQVQTVGTAPLVLPDSLALIAWAMGDKLKQHLKTSLEASYQDIAPDLIMPAAERSAKLRQLQANRLSLMRSIAEATWARIEGGDGDAVVNLRDLDARAILGVDIAK